MSLATRIWLMVMAVGWAVLVTGWLARSTPIAAVFIFFVFAIECWDNVRRSR
jgi:ABC-type uncharacterized transport system permease subunit